MLAHLVERLQTLQQENSYFHAITRGIERECLRTTEFCRLAPTPHSEKLGSKLTHPSITTDYSENLLEFITLPHTSIEGLMEELTQLHAFTVQTLPQERLWPLSMPCILGTDQEIPIANYGTSNSGRMKMHYRQGLSHRYGRHMQCIAGVHYNFSLPHHFWTLWHEVFDPCHDSLQDCINANYMRLIRNYLKHAWLIFILMGASPACDQSFFVNTPPDFLSFYPPQTLFAPEATSLRMSPLGYHPIKQENILISYNHLNQYLEDLLKATQTPSAEYEAILQKFGKESQLNPNLLQIEAELYAPIRPKRTVHLGERPIHALGARGIEYIEVRGLDVNPYSPIGIEEKQIYFLDTFLLFCLLHNSPPFSSDNASQWSHNQETVVLEGLSKNSQLELGAQHFTTDEWAEEIFEQLLEVTKVLDQVHEDQPHARAVESYRTALRERKALPSAQQLDSLAQGFGFIDFGKALSDLHHEKLMAYPLPQEVRSNYEQMAQRSLMTQKAMEADNSLKYEDYVRQYFEA